MNNTAKNIHFIAIGGSIMHNLAIALHKKGYNISGSDDEIFEPSLSKLSKYGLLPQKEGWEPDKIHQGLDAVILGMHARKDNPELLRAREMGIKIYSFPDYLYEQSLDKQRIVIAGSHGKTTITSIIIHVLKFFNRKFDFAVGAQLEGFETMVELSDDAPVIIIEGDEYLSSPIDDSPKFLKYHHHIGLISGVAWDHINVFPSEEKYVRQFDKFADATPKGGTLVYCEEDPLATVIGSKERPDVLNVTYKTHPFTIENGTTFLTNGNDSIPIRLFGKHNLQNINGAREVLKKIGISDDQFYEAIQNFEGASKRLEYVYENESTAIIKDYAHAPSKVRATTLAVKEQYPERDLVACLELHTFSSLNKDFLKQYNGTMKYANVGVIYYNPQTLEHKRLEPITPNDIKKGFGDEHLNVFDDASEMVAFLKKQEWDEKNLLLMSSGTFNNLDFEKLKDTLK
ncbi:Cytoplasmic peptidoglycan synthetase [Fulvivirga imtechensis AK7]|uniref:Cytoplasmic peptidoglycan synthetase n=1 Tax=Fulvivirga imtechensis AK7 TaxID=1237149 RepID=L8JKC6_9BACT|nr:Mur ligase family protein [Fulvivirga imtechensis]ELR69361.1 Cytoplasmic peptidoglycan synthetase [Fulvivirga imtechensis AK7]